MKTETVEEFLRRGGQVTKVIVEHEPQVKQDFVKSAHPNVGYSSIMSMEEADLYYGDTDGRKVAKVKKFKAKLNVEDLPKELRDKFCREIMEDE